ncbi:MAG TPA: hypothetical protein PK867_22400 [Pirellulales bacterium]|nr:hypothetical protein [Pirellulales bacterium]
MVLNLSLSRELEDRLRQEAERRGASLDAVTIELLDRHLPYDADQRCATAVAMLNDWAHEDQTLSGETAAENAAVLRALDEHRASYRKLFENVLGDTSRGPAGAA